jgi:hypothetical protein
LTIVDLNVVRTIPYMFIGDHTMGRRDMGLTMIMVKIQNEMIVRMKRLGVKNRSAVVRDALASHVPKLEATKRRKDKHAIGVK